VPVITAIAPPMSRSLATHHRLLTRALTAHPRAACVPSAHLLGARFASSEVSKGELTRTLSQQYGREVERLQSQGITRTTILRRTATGEGFDASKINTSKSSDTAYAYPSGESSIIHTSTQTLGVTVKELFNVIVLLQCNNLHEICLGSEFTWNGTHMLGRSNNSISTTTVFPNSYGITSAHSGADSLLSRSQMLDTSVDSNRAQPLVATGKKLTSTKGETTAHTFFTTTLSTTLLYFINARSYLFRTMK